MKGVSWAVPSHIVGAYEEVHQMPQIHLKYWVLVNPPCEGPYKTSIFILREFFFPAPGVLGVVWHSSWVLGDSVVCVKGCGGVVVGYGGGERKFNLYGGVLEVGGGCWGLV